MSMSNETSDTVTNLYIESLRDKNMDFNKCISLYGDNTNFGGLLHQGKNNVSEKLKNAVNKHLEGIGCPAHILHNCMQAAADVL